MGLFTRSAQAQVDQTWMATPATTNWNTTDLNWDAGAAWVNNDNAIFGGAPATNLVTELGIVFNNITFNTNYTIAGGDGSLVLGDDLTSQITVVAGATGTINETIVDSINGPSSLLIPGPGTLSLGANNSAFTGDINIQSGTVIARAVSGGNGLSALGVMDNFRTGTITVQTGAMLSFGANSVLGAGTIYITKPEMVIKGTLLADTGDANQIVPNVTLDGGKIRVGAGKSGWKALNFSGSVTVAGTTPSFIEATNINANTAATLGSGNVASATVGTIFNVADVTGTAAADLTVSAILARAGSNNGSATNGAPALTKTGAGTMLLATNNTYIGKTLIQQGTLAVGSAGSISNSAVFISAGATFDVTAKSAFSFITNSLNINGLSLGSGSTSGAGNFNLGSGKTLTLGTGSKISGLADGSSMGKVTVTGDLTLNNNTVVVDVINNALAIGTYTLLDCTGTLTGTTAGVPVFTGLGLGYGLIATVVTTPGAGGKVQLVVAAADFSAFKITAASSAIVAGATNTLTITAVDVGGTTATSITRYMDLTFSGLNTALNLASPTVTDLNGVPRNFGVPTTLLFVNGVAVVTGNAANLVAKLAETSAISVTDGQHSDTSAGGSTVTFTVAPGAATAYRLVADNESPSTGANVTLAIRLVDQFQNNLLFTGSTNLTFSGLGTGANGVKPTVNAVDLGVPTAISFTAGAATATLVATKIEGPVTNRVTDGTVTTAGVSGLVSILNVSGISSKVRVETAASGAGSLVPAQTVGIGNSLTVYAISRDAYDNYIQDEWSAIWSTENETGGVANTDLLPNESASANSVFTGHLIGTGNIRASASGLTSVDSGLITVQCIAATASNPSNILVASGSPAIFAVTSPSSAPTYQWQVNKGSGFQNVTDYADGDGATTPTLTINSATAAMNGYQYRTIVSVNICDSSSYTNQAATLWVADSAATSFRSRTNGSWNSLNTWQFSTNNGAIWHDAGFLPNSGNNTNIAIMADNTVRVTDAQAADQLIVNTNALLVITNGTLTIDDGDGADLNVIGTLRIDSNHPLTLNGQLRVAGSYIWNTTNAPAFPAAAQTTWADGSLAKIAKTLSTANANAIGITGHNFYDFTVDFVEARRLILAISGIDTRVRNDLKVNIPTNGSSVALIGVPATPGRSTLTVDGDVIISTGTGTKVLFCINNTQTNTLVLKGDMICTGFIDTFGDSYLTVEFVGTGAQALSLPPAASITNERYNYLVNNGSIVNIGSNIPKHAQVLVRSGGRMNMGTNTFTGIGITADPSSFIVESGATLGIGSLQGITASGATGNVQTTVRTFSPGGNYIYTGGANQVLGSGLPLTVNNLTLATGMTNYVTATLPNADASPKYAVTGTLTPNNTVIGVTLGNGAATANTYALYTYGTLVGSFNGTAQLLSGFVGSPLTVGASAGTVSLTVPAVIVPTAEPIVVSPIGGGQYVMSWTGLGWTLQAQTNNSLAVGLSTNWVAIPGATSPYTNTVNPGTPTTFFRLVYP